MSHFERSFAIYIHRGISFLLFPNPTLCLIELDGMPYSSERSSKDMKLACDAFKVSACHRIPWRINCVVIAVQSWCTSDGTSEWPHLVSGCRYSSSWSLYMQVSWLSQYAKLLSSCIVFPKVHELSTKFLKACRHDLAWVPVQKQLSWSRLSFFKKSLDLLSHAMLMLFMASFYIRLSCRRKSSPTYVLIFTSEEAFFQWMAKWEYSVLFLSALCTKPDEMTRNFCSFRTLISSGVPCRPNSTAQTTTASSIKFGSHTS